LLENEHILLRAIEPEDLDRLYVWENNALLWDVGNTRNPYSRFVLKQYIVDSAKDIYENKQLRLMIVSRTSGETVGTVDLFDFDIHNSRIALGLFVNSPFQGKGFAKACLHLIEEYVFNYHIAESNTASRRMFEQEEYETNGVLKNWIKTIDGYENIIVFQLFRDTFLNEKKQK